jgi:hypothetical protein
MLNSAGLTGSMRKDLWTEAATTETDIENLISSRKDGKSANPIFHDTVHAANMSLRVFGDMAVEGYHHNRKIWSKLDDKRATAIYLGRAKDHSSDTHRFFQPTNEKAGCKLWCTMVGKTLPSIFQAEGTVNQFWYQKSILIFWRGWW